ncbi:acetyl-CoA carboxylase carboxyltransferase subunit alpha, partial [bacterium]|nr:acetyl-CoA carboxylase carboxyltransferase subunit alpha [bacterium]
TPWQRIQMSRHPKRPYTKDYIRMIFDDFVELCGDRKFSDDRAIITGIATFEGRSVAVIGHQKGRDIKEKIESNFGCAHPDGYRKALRVMELAEKFKFPVIIFIDTPGAYPGIGAEERGQSEAIAYNIMRMVDLKTLTIAFVIGEGGSGGALGIGVTDVFAILENAYYSVISPEGCSAILWKDKSKVEEAVKALKITAKDLLEMGIVDEIIKESREGAHRDPQYAADNIKMAIIKYLDVYGNMPMSELLKRRYERYRNMGQFKE